MEVKQPGSINLQYQDSCPSKQMSQSLQPGCVVISHKNLITTRNWPQRSWILFPSPLTERVHCLELTGERCLVFWNTQKKNLLFSLTEFFFYISLIFFLFACRCCLLLRQGFLIHFFTLHVPVSRLLSLNPVAVCSVAFTLQGWAPFQVAQNHNNRLLLLFSSSS